MNVYHAHDPDGGNEPAGNVDPAGAAAVAAPSPTEPAVGTLLDSAGAPSDVVPAPEGEAAKPFAERVPEKYRVLAEDGTLDLAATAEKVEAARASLETKLGKGAASDVPASPDDYKIELVDAEGKPMDPAIVSEFTGDPLFKTFAKDAHALGMTEAQMQFVTQRYMALAPQLIAADKQVTRDEASRELSALWNDERTFNSNLQAADKAVKAFGAQADGPGAAARLNEKFGNDPDFLALMARVGSELAEDKLPTGAGGMSEVDVDALQRSKAYWDASDPGHAKAVATVKDHYARKFGTAPR